MSESNTKRQLAHEIIIGLFEEREIEQLRLLQQACYISLRELDPYTQMATLRDELDTLYQVTKSGPGYDDAD